MQMETVSHQILFENHATSMNIIFIVSEVSILQIYVDCRLQILLQSFLVSLPIREPVKKIVENSTLRGGGGGSGHFKKKKNFDGFPTRVFIRQIANDLSAQTLKCLFSNNTKVKKSLSSFLIFPNLALSCGFSYRIIGHVYPQSQSTCCTSQHLPFASL